MEIKDHKKAKGKGIWDSIERTVIDGDLNQLLATGNRILIAEDRFQADWK